MTRATLAIYFGVKPRTIQRWEKLGMPTIHIGGIVRYSLPEIYKWIFQRRCQNEQINTSNNINI